MLCLFSHRPASHPPTLAHDSVDGRPRPVRYRPRIRRVSTPLHLAPAIRARMSLRRLYAIGAVVRARGLDVRARDAPGIAVRNADSPHAGYPYCHLNTTIARTITVTATRTMSIAETTT